MLKIQDIKKKYGKTEALKGVSLTIDRGEIVGLFGENGAGKTTLMKCILGLAGAMSGEVTLDGEPITRKNIDKIAFATCEHSFFATLTAHEHMEFYKAHFDNFNEKRFHGLIKFFELPVNKPIRALSTGQQNQFEVIMALSQGADYIFMDEPFAGNDIFNREDFYKVLLGILEPHETIVLSTHLIEEVSDFVGRAVLIRKGELVGDATLEELEEKGQTLVDYVKETYGYRADRVGKALDEIAGEL